VLKKMMSLWVVDNGKRSGQNPDVKLGGKIQFTVNMEWNILFKVNCQLFRLQIVYMRAVDVGSFGYLEENIESLEQIDTRNIANIQQPVIGNSLRSNEKTTCKPPANGNRVHETG
jgi:hypothetical protein